METENENRIKTESPPYSHSDHGNSTLNEYERRSITQSGHHNSNYNNPENLTMSHSVIIRPTPTHHNEERISQSYHDPGRQTNVHSDLGRPSNVHSEPERSTYNDDPEERPTYTDPDRPTNIDSAVRSTYTDPDRSTNVHRDPERSFYNNPERQPYTVTDPEKSNYNDPGRTTYNAPERTTNYHSDSESSTDNDPPKSTIIQRHPEKSTYSHETSAENDPEKSTIINKNVEKSTNTDSDDDSSTNNDPDKSTIIKNDSKNSTDNDAKNITNNDDVSSTHNDPENTSLNDDEGSSQNSIQNEPESSSRTKSDLDEFINHLSKGISEEYDFTLDYLETSVGLSYNRECPSKAIFSLGLLQEILCNLEPSHKLWNKIKYAAFILNLAERKANFGLLYNVFHKVEVETRSKNLNWDDEEVKKLLEDQIVAKVNVKQETSRYGDQSDRKGNNTDYMAAYNLDNDFNAANDEFETMEMKPVIFDPQGNHGYLFGDEDNYGQDNANMDFDYYPNREDRDEDYKPKVKKRKMKIKHEIGEGPAKKKRKGKLNKPKMKKSKDSNGESVFEGKKEKKPNRKAIYKCPQCDFNGLYQLQLDKHAFEKHQATRLCMQCGFLSNTYKEFIDHDKTHFFKCEICDKKMFGQRSLKLHMKKIHDPKKVEKVPCDICGSFLFPNSLKLHILQVHTGEIHKCDLCGFITNSKYSLTAHKKVHFKKIEQCPDCGKWFKFLARHYSRSCSAKKTDRLSCDLCDSTFAFKQGLATHIKNVHHRITHQCDQCEFQCNNSGYLKVHIRTKHEKQKIFTNCQICGTKTTHMEYHMKTYHYEDFMKDCPSEQAPPPSLVESIVEGLST